MKRKIWVGICIIIIIILGILAGIILYEVTDNKDNNINNNVTNIIEDNNINIINTIEISNQEEQTTPYTLIDYTTYYAKCYHYINKYEDIDVSAVNLTREEIQEKYREWNVEDFTSEQIILENQKNEFCNEHFNLRLTDNIICIYKIDEIGNEEMYKKTDITPEFLTQEDIIRLDNGIDVYGRESLTAVLEDYE